MKFNVLSKNSYRIVVLVFKRFKRFVRIATVLTICLLIFAECFLGVSTLQSVMRNVYLDTCKEFTISYSNNISTLMNQFFANLSMISKIPVKEEGYRKTILNNIAQMSHCLPINFSKVNFVDNFGYLLTEDGSKKFVGNTDYFKEIVVLGKDYYISKPVINKETWIESFYICDAFYSEEGHRLGFYMLEIPLIEIINSIHLNGLIKKTNIFIIDSFGNFLFRPNERIISKDYSYNCGDAAYSYIDKAFEPMTRLLNGYVNFESKQGEKFTIVHAPIKNTNWSLGIALPKSDLDHVFATLCQKMVLIIGIFALIFVSIIGIIGIVFYYRRIKEINDEATGYRDSLTGLPTQILFEKDMHRLLSSNKDVDFMVISFNLHGLKYVSQSYGEQVGNDMLILFADHLNYFAKTQKGYCSRGYANYFYAIVPVKNCQEAINNFYKEFYQNSEDTSQTEVVSVNIKSGIVFAGKNYAWNSIKELIENASYARDSIKENPEKNYVIFDNELSMKSIREKKIEACFPYAFANNEFYIVFQPKISLNSEHIVGAEALVRWNSKILGEVLPDEFLPILEKNGGIIKLDFIVYEQVFKFMNEMIKNKQTIVPISVNMSRRHVSTSDFVDKFIQLVRKYQIPTDLIEIEILEHTFSINSSQFIEIIDELHKHGFKVAMDDFGSGESSLNMLDTIPIDTMKIDRNFLGQITDWDRTQQIVKKIVELAHELKKSVVCEGVESKKQIDFLNSINCDTVQGFFYSKPLKEDHFVDFMKNYL